MKIFTLLAPVKIKLKSNNYVNKDIIIMFKHQLLLNFENNLTYL